MNQRIMKENIKLTVSVLSRAEEININMILLVPSDWVKIQLLSEIFVFVTSVIIRVFMMFLRTMMSSV